MLNVSKYSARIGFRQTKGERGTAGGAAAAFGLGISRIELGFSEIRRSSFLRVSQN